MRLVSIGVALVALVAGSGRCGDGGAPRPQADATIRVDASSAELRMLEVGARRSSWLEGPSALVRVESVAGAASAIARELRLEPLAEQGEVRLRLSVENRSRQAVSVRVGFPTIEGLRSPTERARATHCFPQSGAVIGRDPCSLREPRGGRFPLQFVSISHEQHGAVWLRTEDEEQAPLSWALRRDDDHVFALEVWHGELSLAPGERRDLTPVVIGASTGTWHDGLRAYREWASRELSPVSSPKPALLEAFSLRQLFLWPNLGRDVGSFDATTRSWQLASDVRDDIFALGGVDMAHVFDWARTPRRGRVGDYAPWETLGGAEGLRAQIDAVRELRVPLVGLYVEGYLASKESQVAGRHGEDWEMRTADGARHDRFGASYRYLCPGAPGWREHLARAAREALDATGADGVYLDEVGFGWQYACARSDHGHAPTEPQIAREHALVGAVREAIGRERLLYSEETPLDTTMALLDGSFTYALSRARSSGGVAPVNLSRFARPGFKTFEILRVDAPLGADLEGVRAVLFNGEGIWLAGNSASEEWFPMSVRREIARARRVFRRHCGAFTSSNVTPLVPVLDDRVAAHRFVGPHETVWTVLELRGEPFQGEVLRLPRREGLRYFDAWNGRELRPSVDADRTVATLALELPPRGLACVVEVDESGVDGVRLLGGHVFRKAGRVVEVVLDGTKVHDDDLRGVGRLLDLTDLSLEGTEVGDAGLVHLRDLRRLEWLNLWRTRVSDEGLRTLSSIESLRHLPVGGTQVTDAGLEHLATLRELEYLGLRETAVTDEGLPRVAALPRLRGLSLAGTVVSDAGVAALLERTRLTRLWLDDTSVSDELVEALARCSTLRELYVRRTRITDAGLRRLRESLPDCELVSVGE